jgi:hypothetical protein
MARSSVLAGLSPRAFFALDIDGRCNEMYSGPPPPARAARDAARSRVLVASGRVAPPQTTHYSTLLTATGSSGQCAEGSMSGALRSLNFHIAHFHCGCAFSHIFTVISQC